MPSCRSNRKNVYNSLQNALLNDLNIAINTLNALMGNSSVQTNTPQYASAASLVSAIASILSIGMNSELFLSYPIGTDPVTLYINTLTGYDLSNRPFFVSMFSLPFTDLTIEGASPPFLYTPSGEGTTASITPIFGNCF